MKLKLTIAAGPDRGREFVFDGHETFLVGRTEDCHFRVSNDDPYCSRRQFLLEIDPPRCRLTDLESRNGTLLNGVRIQTAEVGDGDEIAVGQTVFRVSVDAPESTVMQTLDLPNRSVSARSTVDFQPTDETEIPGYRVGSELGRGGMGVVYRAVRERDGLTVALKTILPAAGANPKHVERFIRECKILSELDHPNIVKFREVGRAGEVLYLAMDLEDGTDLGEWLKERGPQDVPTAVRIVCQMLKGLAYAHDKGYIHRDIKPGNILIGRSGPSGSPNSRVAKLADFGLGRAYESSRISGLTMQGEIGGTPAFMAPEQVTHYRDVKPAADQYSAAATLYKILTDCFTHDFPKGTGAQLSHLVAADPVPIRRRRPEIPETLAEVIHRALSRDPQDRYPDATAFRTALKRFA